MIIIDAIIFSLQKFGGISTYFKHLTDGLLKSDFKNEIILYNKNNYLQTDSIDITEERFLERFRPVKINNNLTDKVLLHSSYYRYTMNKNVKNIITIYDFIYEKFEKNIIKKYIHIFQKKLAVRNSSAVICISESTKKDFLNYYPKYNPDNVFVTHLAHSTVSVETDKNFVFEKKFTKPYVIFVGMRSFHKNFSSCVKALESIQVDFKIIGGGKLNQKEIALLEENISGRYQHLNNVNNEELNKYYTNAICLLYPSIYEGFGLPILEAMANGCAVITTNFSSLPEVSGNAAIELDDPSPNCIREAINILLDPVVNREMINKGFRNIERFGWEKTISKTFDVYNIILSR